MRNINFAKTLLMTLASINVSYASTYSVFVPFNNVPLFAEKYSGLNIGYDLTASPQRMIVCTIVNKKFAYLDYSYGGDGRKRMSVVEEKFILSSKYSSNTGYIWVPRTGSAILYDDVGRNDFDVLVSCNYEPDV